MNTPSPPRTQIKAGLSVKEFWFSDYMIIGYIALLNLIMHLLAIKGFGYFRDEFYYIACSEHLAFGYVDQPPLSIFLLKAIRLILGDSLVALRIFPVFGHTVFIFLTGVMAKKLGGGKFALLLAAVAAFAPLGNYFMFTFYSMNFWDILIWQVCILLVLHIIKSDNTKYWLLFGIVAGIGLQNKISVLFLLFGIGAGVILTKKRICLKDKYFWIGFSIAGLLFLPYVLWNAMHDWATLEFMQNARAYKMTTVSPLEFFSGQVLYNNPATLLIWLLGLWFFLFHEKGKEFRMFGWMFLAIYVVFTIQSAKDYYLAAAYPILFAGGAVLLELWLKKKLVIWIRPVLIFSLFFSTLLLCPLTLPIISVEDTIIHLQRIGISGTAGERHELGALPQHFADMHGWEEMVATVAQVYNKLTPEEQAICGIYVRNYGEAGAIDFFGKKYGLPNATCPHNNYWLWGPTEFSGDVMIIFGFSRDVQRNLEDLQQYFESVEYGATFTCDYCMPYENNRPMFICRNMKISPQEIWDQEKNYN